MSTPVVSNFMRQQGFPDEPADACNMRFAGLYFQPRIVFSLVIVGIVLQSPWVFLLLSAVLWWNVLFPGVNPFERAYNRLIATSRGRIPLGAAPRPRRFSQRRAAAFLLGAAVRAGVGARPPGETWNVSLVKVGRQWSVTVDGPDKSSPRSTFIAGEGRLREQISQSLAQRGGGGGRTAVTTGGAPVPTGG